MLVSCSLVNFRNLGPTSMVHGFTDSISYSLNGWLLSGWALIKHPWYARSCAESQRYNNQQGRQSYSGDLENGKAMRNPERRSSFWNLQPYLPPDEKHTKRSSHQTEETFSPRQYTFSCSRAPSHCARSVPTTSTHWRRATAHPRGQQ